MIKLNKNQRKFFSSAVSHFGAKSIDVRLIDLRKFAEENDLIIPTSALKKYCHRKDQLRGHYDLTLTGYEIPPPPPLKETIKGFTLDDEIIKEMSVFASSNDDSKPKTNKKPKYIYSRCKNPVYLLVDGEDVTISVHKTAKGAYDNINILFHSGCDKTFTKVKKELTEKGYCCIKSNNCGLWGYISEQELKI
jgi:hypothetical protein